MDVQEFKRSGSPIIQALLAIAGQFGVEVSFDELEREGIIDDSSNTGDGLISLAHEIGIEARLLRCKFKELSSLAKALPAILPVADGGALILEGIASDHSRGIAAIVRDPSTGTSESFAIDEHQLEQVWRGEVILLKRQLRGFDETQPFGLRWLLGQVLIERALFGDIMLAAIVSTLFALTPPFLVMIIVDRVLVHHSASTLNVLAGAILLLVIFETILSYLKRFMTVAATTRIDGRLNLFMMQRLLKLPMEYFEHTPAGRTLNKIGQMWKIRHFLTGQLFGAFLDSVPLLGIIPAMLVLEWRLCILAFACAGVIFFIISMFLGVMHRRNRELIAAEQARSAHLVETLNGMKTIKSLSLEGRRRKEWDRLVARVVSAQHAMGLTANFPQTLTLPFERFIYSGCLVTGAYIALDKPDLINPGALVAFAMLSMRVASPLVKIAHLQQEFAEVRGAIAEVASIMNSPPEEIRRDGLRLPIKGEIEFRDVRFRYSPSSPFALDGVSFTVPSGSMVGIMGRSGSGKTTVTRLLQRLNCDYEGMIKIDGMDLREMDLTHLRTHIGVVPQENFLFTGTIKENIAIAKPSASFSEVVRAAQLAGAEEFIERLARGYDTKLEEGATNLSGGQRQRLAIARALLIDPPVMILDEATSALDAESEAIVNANLKRMAKGRTVLSISHRLSMLVEADIILVLERGKLYDLGAHEELLHRCDIYRHMWYQQNRHLDPALNDVPLLTLRA